jgi:hypothetical protein
VAFRVTVSVVDDARVPVSVVDTARATAAAETVTNAAAVKSVDGQPAVSVEP